MTLGDDGNYFDITGTTAITSIATVGVGAVVRLHFDAILVLTHHATDLVLPGGANITTAAGDEAEFVEYAVGDWRCVNYQRNGLSAWEQIGAAVNISAPQASVVWTDLSVYRDLRITGFALPTSDGASLGIRLSVNNGSSYIAAYDSIVVSASGSSITATSSNGDASPNITGSVGNLAAGEGADISSLVVNQFNTATGRAKITSDISTGDTAGGVTRRQATVIAVSDTPRNALQLIWSAGDMAAGSYFTLEGIRG